MWFDFFTVRTCTQVLRKHWIAVAATELRTLLEDIPWQMVQRAAVPAAVNSRHLRWVPRTEGALQDCQSFLAEISYMPTLEPPNYHHISYAVISMVVPTYPILLVVGGFHHYVSMTHPKASTLCQISPVQLNNAAVTQYPKGAQEQYEAARLYKDHIDLVKLDRELEEWIQVHGSLHWMVAITTR